MLGYLILLAGLLAGCGIGDSRVHNENIIGVTPMIEEVLSVYEEAEARFNVASWEETEDYVDVKDSTISNELAVLVERQGYPILAIEKVWDKHGSYDIHTTLNTVVITVFGEKNFADKYVNAALLRKRGGIYRGKFYSNLNSVINFGGVATKEKIKRALGAGHEVIILQ